MSAEREREGRRALTPLTRLLTVGGLAVGLAVSSLTPAPIADAAWSATASDPDGVAIEVVAAPAANGIVRPGDTVSVRVTVTNTGTEPSGSITVALSIDGARAVDSQQLATWFAEDALGDGALEVDDRPVTSTTLSSLEPDASAVLDLIVPSAEEVLSGSFGPRLATVRAALDDVELALDHTALVWVPDGTTAPVAATTFVAAITTPGESAAFLSADDLASYTAEAGALTRTLDAVAGRPVLLAIDPRIIASIRLLGTQAPASATQFLDRLQAAPNESFLLPWADADPLATIAAVGSPLPNPEGAGLVTTTAEGDNTPAPNPTPSPEQSVRLAELTAWPVTLEGVVWADRGGLTADALPLLAEQGASVVIAPGSFLEQAAVPQQVGDLLVLRADDALSAAAREASLAISPQRFDRAMARVSALLAATGDAEPGIPALIALSRDRLADTGRLLDTIAQTVALPWSTGAAASAALGRTAVSVEVIESSSDEGRLAAVRAALAAEAEDRIFATIAVTPEAITDVRRLDLLAALSVGWGDQSIDALQSFVRESEQLRSSVQVAESSPITLATDRASLPVTVQNGLDVAVRVFVHVDPDTAQLRVTDPRVETLVEPRSQTRALVPVESLTNGQVNITVTVRDADSRVIGSPTRVALNLQAGWETAGTIAVAIALLLLLTVGITRDIRKRRRRRAEQS